MKYGHEDKKTGLSIHRDCYAEQSSEPRDIKFNYMIMVHGNCIYETENPQELASYLVKLGERSYQMANFLRKIGKSRPSVNEPTGDK